MARSAVEPSCTLSHGICLRPHYGDRTCYLGDRSRRADAGDRAHGTVQATPEFAHSVHVEVQGLSPDRWYWYRFHAGDATSPVARTRTAPPRHATPDKLRFAFVSCQKYENGYYTGFDCMAQESPDLIVHLGDYIYEKGFHASDALHLPDI